MGGSGYSANGTLWLFNFNNASEYNYVINEGTVSFGYNGDEMLAIAGGAVHTVAQLAKGLQFSLTSSTYAGGKVTLYGLTA